MKKTIEKSPYIKSNVVLDKYGNQIADDPSKVPLLVSRCKALSLFLETGNDYIVDRTMFDEYGFLKREQT
ncbi:hypothetical protein [Paenibacillus kandeliae]|uniref:hypothetical protein n=1 Tax=Paenibacillus kandeliae TaxID=3231269 RepID=UPI00345B3BC1